jgi:hypothetical protein
LFFFFLFVFVHMLFYVTIFFLSNNLYLIICLQNKRFAQVFIATNGVKRLFDLIFSFDDKLQSLAAKKAFAHLLRVTNLLVLGITTLALLYSHNLSFSILTTFGCYENLFNPRI